VLKGSPWTFNNHLLVLYKLELGEDPLQIPLVLTPFWVQIYNIPTGLFSDILAVQLGNFLGNFMEHDVSFLGKGNRNFMRIRVQIDIRRPLKRRKKISFGGKCSYVNFKYERLSLFCFYCGRLGHNDSFCEERMNLGMKITEMGWDLSLRAQSRRSLAMNSIWLREEGDGDNGGINAESGNLRKGQESPGWMIRYGENVDPVLGFKLTGGSLHAGRGKENSTPNVMEQDLEDVALVGEEGKKRPRGETEDIIGKEELRSVLGNRRMVDINHLSLAAAKWQADLQQ
ncbi:hypothetical protein Goarm_023125, partial [Gossypium armourianum]|nr:hypothetical protein [Gossypium armourianum]